MPFFIEDESGPIEYGHFYHLFGDPTEIKYGRGEPGWIFSDVPEDVESLYCRANILADRPAPDIICKVSPRHVLRSAPLTEIRIQVYGDVTGPVIPCDGRLLVNAKVNEQLRKSGLKAADTLRAKIAMRDDEFLQQESDTPEIHALIYPGPILRRRRVMVPPIKACPYCGFAPVVCPECGGIAFDQCPDCKAYTKRIPAERIATVPKEERAIVVPGGSIKGSILDASLWDGSDFCGGNGIVTRRVVDFLLRIHAGPFRAQPLRTYVGSCTPEQRERLEAAKKLPS